MKLNAETQAEYDRLRNGPQKGWFTFLHHGGPVLEETANLMVRIIYIMEEKPLKEILTRLRHIYFVPEEARKAYDEALALAGKAILSLIPNCTWDGKTILSERSKK